MRRFAVALLASMISVACVAPAAGPALETAPGQAPPTESPASPESTEAARPSDAPSTSVPDGPDIDAAVEPVSLSSPPTDAARAFEVCQVNAWVEHSGPDVIAGIGRIDRARDATHYAAITGREPEIQSDRPAWIVQFRGEIVVGTFLVFVDPACIVVDGGDGGFYGTGDVRDLETGTLMTPQPDSVVPDRALPAPIP